MITATLTQNKRRTLQLFAPERGERLSKKLNSFPDNWQKGSFIV
jgi:hypothetical protein